MTVYFVKRHNVLVGGPPKVEGVVLDPKNSVEMLQDVLEMEDACWLSADGKWIVLDINMRLRDVPELLAGDGTVDRPWETKERVGGVVVDAASYVASRVSGLLSWMWPKKQDPVEADKQLC